MADRPFLTARWENLAIISYEVQDSLLAPYLPSGLEPDRLNGRACASLVAFDFLDTRVFGVRWPGYANFPEINLRFYVRDPATGRRGVCFIRELVPKRLVAGVARWIYNEPYSTARMASSSGRAGGKMNVEHTWRFRGVAHSIRVEARDEPTMPPPDSAEHWFKEHEWGFGRDRGGRAITYRVEHPVWRIFPVEAAHLSVDFRALYGPSWSGLTGRRPDSTVLAAGSAVKVFPRER